MSPHTSAKEVSHSCNVFEILVPHGFFRIEVGYGINKLTKYCKVVWRDK